MRALVLHLRPYSFTAEDGRSVSGASITYVDLVSPPADAAPQEELGTAPLTITAPDRIRSNLRTVPGIYELTFHHKRGRGGRVQLALGHAELVEPVNLATL